MGWFLDYCGWEISLNELSAHGASILSIFQVDWEPPTRRMLGSCWAGVTREIVHFKTKDFRCLEKSKYCKMRILKSIISWRERIVVPGDSVGYQSDLRFWLRSWSQSPSWAPYQYLQAIYMGFSLSFCPSPHTLRCSFSQNITNTY